MHVSSGGVKASTFSFVSTAGKPTPLFAENRDDVHQLIQQSIEKNLSSKGLSKVPAGGDVTVAYLLVVGNNAATTEVNDYFGYGRDSTELVEKIHDEHTGGKNPNYFVEGTLIIDLIDTKTYKLIQRNRVDRPLLGKVSSAERAARIQEAVDQALKAVRVSA
jgi:hypothetical protein